MTERPLRRNDIVHVPCMGIDGPRGDFHFFGRVNRRVSPVEVEVICAGRHVQVYRDEWLRRTDYKGKWDSRKKFPIWYPMSTLRKLKQRAAFYYPDVWRKKRDTRRARLAEIIRAEIAEDREKNRDA